MGLRAYIRLKGDLKKGMDATLHIQDNGKDLAEADGSLPASSQILKTLGKWKSSYRNTSHENRAEVENFSTEEKASPKEWGDRLSKDFLEWLNHASFRPIDQKLREYLKRDQPAEILIRSTDQNIHNLPWHKWYFVSEFPENEVVFASKTQPLKESLATHQKVRVLSILGDQRNINVEEDRRILESLPDIEVTFLPEPRRKELDAELRGKESWDILCFSGHSYSQDSQGYLSLNDQDKITIEQLRFALKKAIENGLKLAIFNSCDGLGLAYELEELYIPQLVVMREPINDGVAHEFLKNFLEAYSEGKELHLSLREAREKLHPLEEEYPFATWLPVLFQNSAVTVPTWNSFQAPIVEPILTSSILPSHQELELVNKSSSALRTTVIQLPSPLHVFPKLLKGISRVAWKRWVARCIIGLTIGVPVLGLRYVGALQWPELYVFDMFIRSRGSEPEDKNIVIIEVTDRDLEDYKFSSVDGIPYSLTDSILLELLQRLNAAEPTVIGLDMYRDNATNLRALIQQFTSNQRLIGVCKGGDQDQGIEGIAPPTNMPKKQQGLSDVPTPVDDVARIQMLSAEPLLDSPCATRLSFSAALAEKYFSSMEIPYSEEDDIWQWGNIQFPRLKNWLRPNQSYAHYGPYAKLKVQGHLLLLNYRANQKQIGGLKRPDNVFPHISVGEVLKGELDSDLIRGKIVIIGVTSNATDDMWMTPYRDEHGDPLEIPGVYLQAQMVSQLLSAVEDHRLLLRCLPWILEGALIVSIGALTFLFSSTLRKEIVLVIIPIIGIILYISSFGLIVFTGVYLPYVPMTMGLIFGGTAGLLQGLIEKRKEKIQED